MPRQPATHAPTQYVSGGRNSPYLPCLSVWTFRVRPVAEEMTTMAPSTGVELHVEVGGAPSCVISLQPPARITEPTSAPCVDDATTSMTTRVATTVKTATWGRQAANGLTLIYIATEGIETSTCTVVPPWMRMGPKGVAPPGWLLVRTLPAPTSCERGIQAATM